MQHNIYKKHSVTFNLCIDDFIVQKPIRRTAVTVIAIISPRLHPRQTMIIMIITIKMLISENDRCTPSYSLPMRLKIVQSRYRYYPPLQIIIYSTQSQPDAVCINCRDAPFSMIITMKIIISVHFLSTFTIMLNRAIIKCFCTGQ